MDEQSQNTAPTPSSKTPLLLIGIVVLLLIGGVSFYLIQNSQQAAPTVTDPVQQPTTQEVMEETEPTDVMTQAQEITIEASNFKFSVPEIRVKKGETVRITLVNTQGFHDIVFEEFNARTKQTNAGESETIEFVAESAGTFEYYCSVGQHRQMGMTGNLIVEE